MGTAEWVLLQIMHQGSSSQPTLIFVSPEGK